MSRLALNKSSLQRYTRDLATYRRYLPALDLKRRQLMAERARARTVLNKLVTKHQQLTERAGEQLPMLANDRIDLTSLVEVRGCEVGEQNVVGTRIPVLQSLQLVTRPYQFFVTPHWLDAAAELLMKTVELRLQLRVAQLRFEALDLAAKRVTQRINLFEKVKIPEAKENIRIIKVFLADAERAAVVRAKIAKQKQASADFGSRM